MTANDLVNRITDWAATDKHVVTRAGEDYYEQADDLAQLIWGYLSQIYFTILAAKNISAGNQTTNLSVYEAGGASEKPNGWRVKVSVTGGLDAGTYNMLWTGTTYTIGGVAIATDDRRLVGESYMILELNKTTGDWIIIEDGRELVFSYYTNGSAVAADTPINYSTKVIDKYACVTTGAAWKWTCPKSGWYVISVGYLANAAGNTAIAKAGTIYRYGAAMGAGARGAGTWGEYLTKGEYVDARSSNTISATANVFISIMESRR